MVRESLYVKGTLCDSRPEKLVVVIVIVILCKLQLRIAHFVKFTDGSLKL